MPYFVLDRYEVWAQGILIEAEDSSDAVIRASQGNGEDIDLWFQPTDQKPYPAYGNAEEFNTHLHTLPKDHPLLKDIERKQKLLETVESVESNIKTRLIRLKEKQCTCNEADDMCPHCVADELLDTLHTFLLLFGVILNK